MGRRGLLPLVVLLVVLVVGACQPAKKKTPPPAAPPGPALTKTDFVTGLSNPWDLAFLDDGTMFFTERHGNISVRLPDGTINVLTGADLPGDPDVHAQGEAGMLGLAIDPAFSTTRAIYTCFASTAPDVRVARWTVSEDFKTLVERIDIVTGAPLNFLLGNTAHAGCRVRFRPGSSELFVTIGDSVTGLAATDPNSLAGKVLRVTTTGAPVAGNPFIGTAGDDRIYTMGHRNPQGLAFSGGQVFSVEHGSNTDDEVNLLVAGGNYGWDGDNNGDAAYEEHLVPMTDFIQYPNARGAVWSSGFPTIAPSGATFLSGPQWGAWNGALALAVLQRNAGGLLRILFLGSSQTDAAINGAPPPLPRLRVAVQGPDGNLYIATDVRNGGGAIWRVTPG